MGKRNEIIVVAILISLICIQCKDKSQDSDIKTIQPKEKVKINTTNTNSIVTTPNDKSNDESEKLNYDSIIDQLEPKPITIYEFENFKKKSNYIQVIETFDKKNPSELLGGKGNKDNIRYYHLPTEINTKEYLSNSILFGDLNEDGKRDCIITAYRSDGYNEVAYFYVFINNGNTFKLVDVKSEDEICGCKKEGWPSLFRYQKIEEGYLKGISMCHYKDAHCCPSMIFQTKVKFIDGELKFISGEFIKDDYPSKRDRPKIDSVLVKSNI